MRMPSFIKYGAAHGIFAVITFVRKRSNFRAGSFFRRYRAVQNMGRSEKKKKRKRSRSRSRERSRDEEKRRRRQRYQFVSATFFGTNCKGGQICHTFYCHSRKFFDMLVDATLTIKVRLL